MESLARHVAFKYLEGDDYPEIHNVTVNTVSIDKLNFFAKAILDSDLQMCGYVTFTSKSIITINIDLYQKSNEWENLGHASYVMQCEGGNNNEVP
jgi:acyl-CoA hydrolase